MRTMAFEFNSHDTDRGSTDGWHPSESAAVAPFLSSGAGQNKIPLTPLLRQRTQQPLSGEEQVGQRCDHFQIAPSGSQTPA